MGAPTLLFNEAAALGALQQFILTAVPEVPQVDVYRARPSAVPGRWGLSVLIVPTTPLPVLQSYMGEQSTAAQQQLARFVFATSAAGAWRVRVLGQQTAAYVAGIGETTTYLLDDYPREHRRRIRTNNMIERLNREITTILQRPDIRSRLLAMGIDAVPSTPQGLAEFTREQSQNYVRLIKEFNIQPE